MSPWFPPCPWTGPRWSPSWTRWTGFPTGQTWRPFLRIALRALSRRCAEGCTSETIGARREGGREPISIRELCRSFHCFLSRFISANFSFFIFYFFYFACLNKSCWVFHHNTQRGIICSTNQLMDDTICSKNSFTLDKAGIQQFIFEWTRSLSERRRGENLRVSTENACPRIGTGRGLCAYLPDLKAWLGLFQRNQRRTLFLVSSNGTCKQHCTLQRADGHRTSLFRGKAFSGIQNIVAFLLPARAAAPTNRHAQKCHQIIRDRRECTAPNCVQTFDSQKGTINQHCPTSNCIPLFIRFLMISYFRLNTHHHYHDYHHFLFIHHCYLIVLHLYIFTLLLIVETKKILSTRWWTKFTV